jgi:uncharacterized membrane protein YcjF (UPF0283 family)
MRKSNGRNDHPSLAHAVERVFETSHQALLAQLRLLRVEAEEDLKRTLEGSALLFGGILLLAIAWIAFMGLAIDLLTRPLSLAVSLAVVGLLNLVLGMGLIGSSLRMLRRLRLMRPDAEAETAEAAGSGAPEPTIPEEREAAMPALEESERQLRRTFEDLVEAVHSRFDLGKHITERPVPWVVGSVLVGFLLAQPRLR